MSHGSDHTNPDHYLQHPSNVECIRIAEGFNFNLGNVVKYVWRAGLKHDDPVRDLEKARWYIDREIKRVRHETLGQMQDDSVEDELSNKEAADNIAWELRRLDARRGVTR